MSPLSADRLFVALQPDRVALVRQSGWRKRRVTAKHVAPCAAGSSWEAAVATLATALADPAWRRCRLEVVLSARFVRTAVMPPVAGMRSGEVSRLAQHCLQEAHGEGSDGWHVTFGDAPWNAPRLVCAIDSELLKALDAAARGAGGRLVSVRPFAMSAFDSRRSHFAEGSAWFVAVEPDWCTLARVEHGTWMSVRTRRLFSAPETEISSLIDQERLLTGKEELPERIVVASPNLPQWRIAGQEVAPVALPPFPGFSPVDDAPVAMALEGSR